LLVAKSACLVQFPRSKKEASLCACDASADAAVSLMWPKHVVKDLGADKDSRGKKAPELSVEQWLNVAAPPQLAGKVILVEFWATW
jgi:hypothetical protein